MKTGNKCPMCGYHAKTVRPSPQIPVGKFAVIDGEGHVVKGSDGRLKIFDSWWAASLEVDAFYAKGFLGVRRVQEGIVSVRKRRTDKVKTSVLLPTNHNKGGQ